MDGLVRPAGPGQRDQDIVIPGHRGAVEGETEIAELLAHPVATVQPVSGQRPGCRTGHELPCNGSRRPVSGPDAFPPATATNRATKSRQTSPIASSVWSRIGPSRPVGARPSERAQ